MDVRQAVADLIDVYPGEHVQLVRLSRDRALVLPRPSGQIFVRSNLREVGGGDSSLASRKV